MKLFGFGKRRRSSEDESAIVLNEAANKILDTSDAQENAKRVIAVLGTIHESIGIKKDVKIMKVTGGGDGEKSKVIVVELSPAYFINIGNFLSSEPIKSIIDVLREIDVSVLTNGSQCRLYYSAEIKNEGPDDKRKKINLKTAKSRLYSFNEDAFKFLDNDADRKHMRMIIGPITNFHVDIHDSGIASVEKISAVDNKDGTFTACVQFSNAFDFGLLSFSEYIPFDDEQSAVKDIGVNFFVEKTRAKMSFIVTFNKMKK